MVSGALAVAAVAAQASASFAVPSGPTLSGLEGLSEQARIDVVVTADLSGRVSPAVRGVLPVEEALRRLLAPAGARAVRLAEGVYRIEPAPTPARRPSPPVEAPEPAQLPEIVVVAPVARGVLAGTEGRSRLDQDAVTRTADLSSSETFADLSATIDSTRLGPGRNKLFIRGVADSAFSGPLQATIGQYFGDLRLTYGSPDPDLAAIDIAAVDVFEGPQASRFGSGPIGGVIRLQPRAPVRGVREMVASLGASATSGGAPGADVALVANTPLGRVGDGRFAVYARREGGFSPPGAEGRRPDDVDLVGGRGVIRAVAGGWTVDLTALAQKIEAEDVQSIETYARDRPADVAEPYANTFGLVGVTASTRRGGGHFTVAASLSRQDVDERYDATQKDAPVAAFVDRRQTATAFSIEGRLERPLGEKASFNGGAALAVGHTDASRRRYDGGEEGRGYGADLERSFSDFAVFGETAVQVSSNLRVAIGGRVSATRILYRRETVLDHAEYAAYPPDSLNLALSPSVSARWTWPSGLSAFARLEQGVRPAGVSEADGGVERYRPDRLTLLETGVRSPDGDPLSGEVSIGWIDWRDIQADTVTQGGDLVIDNVGDGRIAFLQAKGAWRPTETVSLSAGAFLNASRLTRTQPSIIIVGEGDLPNVAPFGAQASLAHDGGYFLGRPVTTALDLRYVGRSRLGVGPALDVPQGGYLKSDVTVRWGDERGAISLHISNPLDISATRYGIGSPYQLDRRTVTPLRPLTVRLGFDVAF